MGDERRRRLTRQYARTSFWTRSWYHGPDALDAVSTLEGEPKHSDVSSSGSTRRGQKRGRDVVACSFASVAASSSSSVASMSADAQLNQKNKRQRKIVKREVTNENSLFFREHQRIVDMANLRIREQPEKIKEINWLYRLKDDLLRQPKTLQDWYQYYKQFFVSLELLAFDADFIVSVSEMAISFLKALVPGQPYHELLVKCSAAEDCERQIDVIEKIKSAPPELSGIKAALLEKNYSELVDLISAMKSSDPFIQEGLDAIRAYADNQLTLDASGDSLPTTVPLSLLSISEEELANSSDMEEPPLLRTLSRHTERTFIAAFK